MIIKLTKKAVNSKTIFDVVHDFVDDILHGGGLKLKNEDDRSIFVAEAEDTLDHLMQEHKIVKYDVIFDYRNNSRADMNAGKFNIVIKYTQYNCLNDTQLIYDVDVNSIDARAHARIL